MILFCTGTQMMLKCDKNKEVAHEAQPNVSLIYLTHVYVFCDLLLFRPAATWNLSVLYEKKVVYGEVIYVSVFH